MSTSSSEHRRAQLRAAKRRQRARETAAGLALYQLKLPAHLAERLKAGMKDPEFISALEAFLCREVLDLSQYPNIALLLWNHRSGLMRPRAAFALLERNWRFLEGVLLTDDEQALIDDLKDTFGQGVINA